MSLQIDIETKLANAFTPDRMVVLNESHLHAGHHQRDADHHATFDGGGETHFRVRIVSAVFAGMPRLARHRAVNDVLDTELKAGLHALAVEPSAPGEPTRW